MGSITYNFLADSILFHEESLKNNFKNETNERLEKELQEYRQFCISNYPYLIKEILDKKSSLKVFSSTEKTSISLLKQTALYIDQFILPDPLFKQTETISEISNVTAKYLGYNEISFDKNKLTNSCKYLKNITPMVTGNYVKIFPLSYHFERTEIPFYAPKDYFNDVLPPEVLNYFRENAIVSSLEKMPSGGWQIMEGKLYPCRGIAIDFKNSNLYSGAIYHLFQTEVLDFNEETGVIKYRQTLPDTPPDNDHFLAWVHQSINSASGKYFEEVFLENMIAADLNSTYLCNNLFTADLVSKQFTLNDTIETYTANKILNMELPFLEEIDIDKLMNVRELDAEIFTNFRIELEKQFRELRTISDEKQLQLKTENILHELNEVQGQKIKQKITHINKQMGINSALALGGLSASFQTAGASLIATALALAKGYKDFKDYKEKVIENPAYLLWKIKKQK
jgi:hypothetical protein